MIEKFLMSVVVQEEVQELNLFQRMLALKSGADDKRKRATSILSVATRLFTGFNRRSAVDRGGNSVPYDLTIIALLICSNKVKRDTGNWIFPHYVIRNIFSMCTFKSLAFFFFMKKTKFEIRNSKIQITSRISGTR